MKYFARNLLPLYLQLPADVSSILQESYGVQDNRWVVVLLVLSSPVITICYPFGAYSTSCCLIYLYPIHSVGIA